MAAFTARVEQNGEKIIFRMNLSKRLGYYEVEPLKAILRERYGEIYFAGSNVERPASCPTMYISDLERRIQHKWTWTIPDPQVRANFLEYLTFLEEQLIEIGILDPKRLDVEDLFRQIVKKRKAQPLIAVGNKVYNLRIEEASSNADFKLEEEFKNEVAEVIASIERTSATQIDKKIAELKQQYKVSYPLTREDFRAGWGTYIDDGNAVLTYDCTYYPKALIRGKDIYKLKDGIIEPLEAILTYDPTTQRVDLWSRSTRNRILTPHSYSSGGICIGDLRNTYPQNKYDLASIKSFMLKIVKQFEMVNLDSLLAHLLPKADGTFVSISKLSDICKMPNDSSDPIQRLESEIIEDEEVLDGEIL